MTDLRVLVCPTAFKGTLSAGEAARSMAEGVHHALPAAMVEVVPLSDGGPGLLEALSTAGRTVGRPAGEAGGEEERAVLRTTVEDPLGRPVEGRLLILSGDHSGDGARTAVAESADACGLHLLSREERYPMETGTEGVGDLIAFAAEAGVDRLFLGLGGSGTCDGGMGAARRLGWRFEDRAGEPVGRGGGALERLSRVRAPGSDGEPAGDSGEREDDDHPAATGLAELTVLADVRNPLLGPRGSARVYGPQKGAGPTEIQQLEAGLARLAELSPRPELRDRPGAGAAGGLGFGCGAFLGGRIVLGAPWVVERVQLPRRLSSADLVVTGEGAFDWTSGMGKLTQVVMQRSRRHGVPVVLACGRIEGEAPQGVRAGDGGGAELDRNGLADLVERLVRQTTEDT